MNPPGLTARAWSSLGAREVSRPDNDFGIQRRLSAVCSRPQRGSRAPLFDHRRLKVRPTKCRADGQYVLRLEILNQSNFQLIPPRMILLVRLTFRLSIMPPPISTGGLKNRPVPKSA